MSVVSPARRVEIETRARFRCEYCHLPARGQVSKFPVDHIVPASLGGNSELPNFALACPHCNAYKWTATHGTDPETGETANLFNPRTQD